MEYRDELQKAAEEALSKASPDAIVIADALLGLAMAIEEAFNDST